MNAYINSPDEFIIKFEMNDATQKALENLNGTIVINNNYDYLGETYWICKETHYYTEYKNGEVVRNIYENISECSIN